VIGVEENKLSITVNDLSKPGTGHYTGWVMSYG
jgi:hypothetical protein